MKKSYILSAILALFMLKAFAQPATAPTAPPTRNASNVISIYGGAYSNLTGTNFNPNWGQTGFATASEITVGTEKIRKYPNLNYQGIEFTASNLTALDSLHLDIWTPDCTKLDVYIIVPGGGPNSERSVTATLNLSGWNSVNIKLSDYTAAGLSSLNNIYQFKFVSNTPASGTTIYLDNIYFFSNANLPTITGFTMPAKKVGDAPFTITDPSSNSTGAFTYSSSDTTIAKVSGKTVTIFNAGTAVITAMQAASGPYVSGSATSNLVVGYDLPSASQNPTAPQSTVKSLLSTVYTNNAIDNNTWRASWCNATADTAMIPNALTIRYTNLVFSGTEFAGTKSIDATTMQYFNIDLWTPNNSTPVKVKLVDFGADNAYGGGDDKTSIEYVLSPAPIRGSWNHYSIPLTSFTGLDTKAHLSQLLFIGNSTIILLENVYFSTTVTILPVNLSEFKAVKNGNSAVLTWKTLSELNNKGFGVERSADGISFNQIQFVNGNGSTTAASQYSTTDNSPLNGTNYYRLRQVDNDGKQTYSATVSVNFSTSNTVGFSFYPNPVKTKIVVTLQSISSTNASISLINADGKTVRTIVLNNQNANSNVQFDVENIARGNYFLVLKDGATMKTSKVLVN